MNNVDPDGEMAGALTLAGAGTFAGVGEVIIGVLSGPVGWAILGVATVYVGYQIYQASKISVFIILGCHAVFWDRYSTT